MKRMLFAVILALALPVQAFAAEASPQGQSGAQVADGEVRKVDVDAKKLTIRHGPLPQLDMPTPMTMVYQVKDPALLDKVKPGDKVKFVAEKIGGAFTVVSIEPAK
jgi:Cu(I)/Ag(I) efflux system protein CusF